MRRGRRDDDGGADTGSPTADTATDPGPEPSGGASAGGRPQPQYGTYGQPLFGRPAYGQPGYNGEPVAPADTAADPAVDTATAGRAAGPARGRPGLIVLTSLLVQLAVVAAVGNTYVVRKGQQFRADHHTLLGEFGLLPSVVSWRVSPQHGMPHTLWLGMLVGLAALFVVALLVALALVRGPITFWRALVGVWVSVLVGVLANGMVRRGFHDGDPTSSAARSVLFRGGGYEIPTGLALGLLAALVAAIVAVKTRRAAVAASAAAVPDAAPGPDPEQPTPWYGDEDPGASPSMHKVQRSVQGPADDPADDPADVPADRSVGDADTTAFGTRRLPDLDPVRRPDPAAGAGADAQATTQFPAAGSGVATAAGEQWTEPRLERGAEPQAEPPAAREQPQPTPRATADEPTRALPTVAGRAAEPAAEPVPQPPAEQAATPEPPATPESAATVEPASEPASEPVARTGSTGASAAQATQQFPRPPDDEELGHHPD